VADPHCVDHRLGGGARAYLLVLGRWMRRDPKRIEKVFTAIEVGDVAEASRLSRDSRDPVLRMMWNG